MVQSCVVTGILPKSVSSTVDVTRSGFGTVQAAIIFAQTGVVSGTSVDEIMLAGAFYDGTNTKSINVFDEDNLGTSNSVSDIDSGGFYIHDRRMTISNVTDGLRLTMSAGTTETDDQYFFAILIKDVVSATALEYNLGTSTSAQTVTVGHPTHVLFGLFNRASGSRSGAYFGFGVAHNGSTLKQMHSVAYDEDAVTTTNSKTAVYNNKFLSDANPLAGTVITLSNLTSTQLDLTCSSSAGSAVISLLSLELNDANQFWMSDITTPASTGDSAVTGVGFTPSVVGTLTGITDSVAFGASEDGFKLGIAAVDAIGGMLILATAQDNATTSNTKNRYVDDVPLRLVTDLNAPLVRAAFTSMDADGYTLNYFTTTDQARSVQFAFGDLPAVPPTLQKLDKQFATITAHRLGGVLI